MTNALVTLREESRASFPGSQLNRERLPSQTCKIRSIVKYRGSSPCAGRNFQEVSECGPRCGPEQHEVRCGDSINHGGNCKYQR